MHFLNEFPFLNGWPSWLNWFAAAAIAVAAFWISYRSISGWPARWCCASLRALAIFFIAVTLLEPTLRREERTGEPGRIHFLVDLSSSMEWTDQLPGSVRTPSRRERLSDHLLNPQVGLLGQLADRFDCQTHAIQNDGSLREIWHTQTRNSTSSETPHSARNLLGKSTELSPLRGALEQQLELVTGDQSPSESCVVFMSDGQSTDSEAFSSLASSFDSAGLPVFTVGYGPRSDVTDVGLTHGSVSIQSYVDGLVTGELDVTESVPSGTNYTIQAISGTKTIWEQEFTAASPGSRGLPFSFPAQDLINATTEKQNSGSSTNHEITFQVACSSDQVRDNNELTLMTRIHAKRNRLLVVDGRSRWETRYLKNLFTRDPAWDVTTCIAAAPNADLPGLPAEERELFDFNLVIFGDINETRLADAFIKALPRFASQRGGGIIFVDGQRDFLRQTDSKILKQMLPVRWEQWD
ncbi:MAG: hypothetical protein AAGG44_16125, partial [Planctomycetota bacterium]